jgi:hypothetical protein
MKTIRAVLGVGAETAWTIGASLAAACCSRHEPTAQPGQRCARPNQKIDAAPRLLEVALIGARVVTRRRLASGPNAIRRWSSSIADRSGRTAGSVAANRVKCMGSCHCLGIDSDTPCRRATQAGAHRAHQWRPPAFARRCGATDLEQWVSAAMR